MMNFARWLPFLFLGGCLSMAYADEPVMSDDQFDQLARRYVKEFPSFSPAAATRLGDHRYDDQLDEISTQARQEKLAFAHRYLNALDHIEKSQLSRANQVDYGLLRHELQKQIWEIDTLQEWAWNPLIYTDISGSAIYDLMSRDFAPLPDRLASVTARLDQLPRFLEQVRQTLIPERVPRIHAETAAQQNRGVISLIEELVEPHLGKLPPSKKERLIKAIATAREAIHQHQTWLEKELIPQAKGDFRLGPRLYEQKLEFTLQSSLTRIEVQDLAQQELERVRQEMYELAVEVLHKEKPGSRYPRKPSKADQQAVIQEALDIAASQIPKPEKVVEAAKKSLQITTAFVKKHDLVTIPDQPLEIIIMPEFQRGVSVAYCDSPGALETGQKTFYAVAPIPENWSQEQAVSFLKEYNIRSIHNLTVHEAMPGHFLQIAHANQYPGQLRAVLSSGTFVEGWACYTEQMMSEEGFLDGDPLMRLVTLKWYLRTIVNALLDQAVHVEGIRRADAMKMLMEDAFQEEREAAGKWTRAQLTSAQLSTYFVGVQEHQEMRRAAEKEWGEEFTLKRYHDTAISFGAPPVKYVRALVLEDPIPD